VRRRLGEARLPVLLIAAGEADEQALSRFVVDIPQAEVIRADQTGHDVLTDGGPEVVDIIGKWLEATDL
jgi:hypothetical protein